VTADDLVLLHVLTYLHLDNTTGMTHLKTVDTVQHSGVTMLSHSPRSLANQ